MPEQVNRINGAIMGPVQRNALPLPAVIPAIPGNAQSWWPAQNLSYPPAPCIGIRGIINEVVKVVGVGQVQHLKDEDGCQRQNKYDDINSKGFIDKVLRRRAGVLKLNGSGGTRFPPARLRLCVAINSTRGIKNSVSQINL